VPDAPATVRPPTAGLWRVARGDNPLTVPTTPTAVGTSGSNRFDAAHMDYGVLYFGSTLEVCFGETLARFRPSIPMLALVEEEWARLGFMNVGTVATDWRHRRSAVNVRLPADTRFLDVDSPITHQFLRRELALGLSALGLQDLDVSTIRGPDRRVTQMISEWAYLNGDGVGGDVAGIRYESRIRAGWECWALFDDEDLGIEVVTKVPITLDMPDLVAVAELFDLQVF
jgi:hypothetical protein